MSINKKLEAFERILGVMDELREKCPWDKKQTIESLRHLTIEETYELSDAIIEGNMEDIKEELGDVFLHLIFYAKIAEEQGAFDIAHVLNTECEKLIKRHPHIYGDPTNAGQVIEVADEAEVKRNWEKLKLKEGKQSILEGVPKSLPALVKAYRIQEKVKQVGFEWENVQQVWKKVHEEIHELQEQAELQHEEKIEEEFGDVLFALINLARFLKIDPEVALERTNKKFIQRFQFIEQTAKKENKKIEAMSLDEMDAIWNEAKEHIG